MKTIVSIAGREFFLPNVSAENLPQLLKMLRDARALDYSAYRTSDNGREYGDPDRIHRAANVHGDMPVKLQVELKDDADVVSEAEWKEIVNSIELTRKPKPPVEAAEAKLAEIDQMDRAEVLSRG